MIPATVLLYLGDQAQSAVIMSQYFQTVHKWMPIISRVRLASLADSEVGSRRADLALLLLTMKLIQDVPGSSSNAVRDSLYLCAKEFAASLDIAGVYTLLKLQANMLIAVYEMGHGIFPAAYASMGCCVAQAMVLGIHHRDAPQILEQPRTWIDWEERQRIWWLIVILERYIPFNIYYQYITRLITNRYIASVGDNRPLLSADPKTTSHLPVNDDAWDSGVSNVPFTNQTYQTKCFVHSKPCILSASFYHHPNICPQVHLLVLPRPPTSKEKSLSTATMIRRA